MNSPSTPHAPAALQGEAIQEFLGVLHRIHPELCQMDAAGVPSSPHFAPRTRTLTVPRLDCSGLDDRDLAAFSVLEHLKGDLVIRDNPAITCLDGLRNLVTSTGRLELVNCGVRELCGLTRLQQAKELVIADMAKLISISGCTALALVENIRISGNPVLQRISGLTGLARMDAGTLTIKDNPALTSVCGLSGLTTVRDGLSISNCPHLADFRFLSSLESVQSIEVDNTGLADGSPLRRLFLHTSEITGTVKFTRNKDLADLSFMAGLTSAGSSLYLNQNSLVNLRGLEGLQRVGASLNLSGNRLTDISQLARLEEINGILLLSANQLTSLRGLENLRRIRTKAWGKDLLSIRLNDNRDAEGRISLADIASLANVQEVTGRLVVYTDGEKGHCYRVKPSANSIFATRNTNVQVFGRTTKTVLPRSHICEMPGRQVVPILFPDMSRAWQDALRRCPGITPHFATFTTVADLVSACRAYAITIVVAIKLTSQKFLAAYSAELRSHALRFIANDQQTLNNCENKCDFKRFMDTHGFGNWVPAYYDRPEAVRYPCIVKPRYGSFGSGQRLVHSPEELGPFPADAVVSEYITGTTEYATNIFFLDRQNYLDVTYRKTFHKPHFILGQDPRDKFQNEAVATEHIDLFLDILDALRFRGICCFDYKPSATGPKIFEINARIGFTLASQPEDLSRMLALYMAHAR